MPVFANACAPLPAWHVFSWGHSPPACCSLPSPVTVPCPHTPGCLLAPTAPLLLCIPQHPHQPLPGTAPGLPPCRGVPGVRLALPALHHRGAAGASRPDTMLMAPCHPLPLAPGGSGCSPRCWDGLRVRGACGWLGSLLCVCVHVHTRERMGMCTHVHICGNCLSPPPR